MSSEETRIRCTAITKSGGQCRLYDIEGTEYCQIHEPVAVPAEPDVSEEEIRALQAELDELVLRVRALNTGYEPPSFSLRRLVRLVAESMRGMSESERLALLEPLRSALADVDMETLKGIWYMLNFTVQYQVDFVKRRFTGDYDTDEWGLDWEIVDLMRPFFTALYNTYWRVETTGVEQIPDEGRALLISNHSGQIPWDTVMVGTAVMNEHPAQRLVRGLYSDLFPSLPWFSHTVVKLGQALATEDNGVRLLEQDELVAVYPEGHKGIAKTYKDRYRLARFGRGGFVRLALKTGAPIIPVAVVGAEETYITLYNSTSVARVIGLPSFPITPIFPWLGLLGLVPLPSKWYIDFGQPIPTEDYGEESADNQVLVSQLSDQVRNTIQEMLMDRLAARRSLFFTSS